MRYQHSWFTVEAAYCSPRKHLVLVCLLDQSLQAVLKVGYIKRGNQREVQCQLFYVMLKWIRAEKQEVSLGFGLAMQK